MKRASDEHAAMRFARAPAEGSQRGLPGWSRARCRRFSRRHFLESLLEKSPLRAAPPPCDTKVFKAALRPHAAARRAIEKSHLHEVGLVDFFDGALLLIDRRRDGAQAYRP